MSDTITISADQIELDNGDVMLQELSVGDPVEIAKPTAGMCPGCWVIEAFESEDRSRARMRRLTRGEIAAFRALNAPPPDAP
ncbi:hypothetical protein [Streptomyces violascens]|uniref:hypothetical protein n=1 Tax=Streptomyces violascens TaxID=67381 RepID=UPI00367C95BE